MLWSGYFESLEDIQLDEKTSFRVYKSKDSGHENRPVLFLLHGGGFSALTWSLLSVEMTDIIHCQCVAVDLRGHGDTVTEEDDDLSAETLSQDIGRLYKKMFPENPPPVLLVGHSMGGAIAVHVAHRRLIDTLIGVTVIDVVEGSAMEALTSMQTFLRSRPTHFKSIPQAIEWSVRSGQIRNVDSARVSMPGQILNAVTRRTATNELPLEEEPNTAIASVPAATNPMTIKEDEEFDAGSMKPPETNKNYTWRIDLTKSEKFWTGWFEGLSEMFLNLAVPKLLLLASIDGLDRTLTVVSSWDSFYVDNSSHRSIYIHSIC